MVKTVSVKRKYNDGTQEVIPVEVVINGQNIQIKQITKAPYIDEFKAIVEYLIGNIDKTRNEEIRNRLTVKQGSSGCKTFFLETDEAKEVVLHVSMYGKVNINIDTTIDALVEALKQIEMEQANVEIIE